MGASFSEPVAPATTPGIFCIMLIPLDKLSLLHAPKDVIDVVRHVVTNKWQSYPRENKDGGSQIQNGGTCLLYKQWKRVSY